MSMEKKDKIKILIILIFTMFVSFYFNLDFAFLAESGLTISSIVLAVYIATIVGLINTNLANVMSTATTKSGDRTQLGVLVSYFQYAISCAILTIILSSVIIFMSKSNNDFVIKLICDIDIYKMVSCLGLVLYVGNIFFLIVIVKFILNRQIWNK